MALLGKALVKSKFNTQQSGTLSIQRHAKNRNLQKDKLNPLCILYFFINNSNKCLQMLNFMKLVVAQQKCLVTITSYSVCTFF